LHPLKSAAFSRRTQIAAVPRARRRRQIGPLAVNRHNGAPTADISDEVSNAGTITALSNGGAISGGNGG
jgi:hypothetical protein